MENIITRLFVTFPVRANLVLLCPLCQAISYGGMEYRQKCHIYPGFQLLLQISIYSHIHHSYLIGSRNDP